MLLKSKRVWLLACVGFLGMSDLGAMFSDKDVAAQRSAPAPAAVAGAAAAPAYLVEAEAKAEARVRAARARLEAEHPRMRDDRVFAEEGDAVVAAAREAAAVSASASNIARAAAEESDARVAAAEDAEAANVVSFPDTDSDSLIVFVGGRREYCHGPPAAVAASDHAHDHARATARVAADDYAYAEDLYLGVRFAKGDISSYVPAYIDEREDADLSRGSEDSDIDLL